MKAITYMIIVLIDRFGRNTIKCYYVFVSLQLEHLLSPLSLLETSNRILVINDHRLKLYCNALFLLYLGPKSFRFIFATSVDFYVSRDYPRTAISDISQFRLGSM